MADIFLSYARNDQPRIERLAAALEEAGYSIWWDRHLEGGGQYSKDIEAQLEGAKAVIVAWSAQSVESEWVRDEAAIARDADKLVPIGLDGTLPPIGFRQRQAIDFSTGDPAAFTGLQSVLDKYVGGEHEAIAPTRVAGGRKLHWALILAPLLLFAAVAAYFVLQGTGEDESAISADARDSIAVLPFVAQSSDEDDQFFADGVTEEILNRLDAVEELRVLPRTTVFSLRDNEDALNVLADKLEVDYIVEGSLRRGGDNVRVTARLIRTSDDETLWSNSYDGTREDVLAFQSDIAEKVAASLDVLLDEEVLARMDAAGLNDPETFALFAKASARDSIVHRSLNLGELHAVSQTYDEVFRRAPNFPAAAILASDFYSHLITDPMPSMPVVGVSADLVANAPAEMQRRLAQARAATDSRQDQLAIDLYAMAFTDDWSQIPRISKDYYARFDGCEFPNWSGFLTDSIDQNNGLADAYLAAEECRASDALNSVFTVDTLSKAGRFDEARAFIERARKRGLLDDDFYPAQERIIAIYEGDIARALELGRQYPPSQRQAQIGLLMLAEDPAAIAAIDEVVASGPPPVWFVMTFYARSGQRERVNALAAAIDKRPGGPTTLQIANDFCACGSVFDIENTPNYAAVLKRSGIKWPFRKLQDWPMKDW